MEEEFKEEKTNKLIDNNIPETITKLLITLDIDSVSIIYPNKDSITSEKIFRKNLVILINYMYELATRLSYEESQARLYKNFYERRIENSILISKIDEKIQDLQENSNGDDYSLINVINILKDLSKKEN